LANKKKIICTVTTDLNYDQRMQRICSTLASEYDVLLIGKKWKNSTDLSSRPFEQKRITCIFNKGILFYAEFNIRLFFILLFSSYSILCSIDLDTILAGYLASRLRSRTMVYDAHELFTEMPEVKANQLSSAVWTRIEQAIVPRLKYAYTESSGYKQVYERNYDTEFEVIRNVPFYSTANYNFEDRKLIVYQGRFNVGRGLEPLIEALIGSDYELHLAGDGEVMPELRRLVELHGLEHQVKFLGMVTPLELKNLLPTAKVGINLLDPNNEHYKLSFPNKLFDYIMAELPQISMNFPNYQNILAGQSAGVLIDELTPESIRNALDRLYTDESFYESCVTACKTLKQEHNWTKEEEKLLSFYRAIP